MVIRHHRIILEVSHEVDDRLERQRLDEAEPTFLAKDLDEPGAASLTDGQGVVVFDFRRGVADEKRAVPCVVEFLAGLLPGM